MKSMLRFALVFGFLLACVSSDPKPSPEDGKIVPPGTTRPPAENSIREVQARGWLIDYRDDVSREDADRLEQSLGFDAQWLKGTFGREERVAWHSLSPEKTADLHRGLMDSGLVEAIEPNAILELVSNQLDGHQAPFQSSTQITDPDPQDYQKDPFYKHQWHMAQIGVQGAHRRTRGKGAVVAVIDTGVAFENHSQYRLARDLNQTSFVHPYNFIDNNEHANDDHGHGTHVAGTIAQSTHNGLGVVGTAPDAAIMPLKVLDGSGRGDIRGIARAISYAAEHGAHVINLSLGGPLPVGVLRKALQHARQQGALPVCAAGNSGGSVGWPARYPECMAVSAVQYDRSLTFYSSRGKAISLAAPGGNVRVDQNGDGFPDGVLQNTVYSEEPARDDYMLFMGTSMAAPHVAGTAALLVSMGVQQPKKVEGILLSTAQPVQGSKEHYGAGILDASKAIAALASVRKPRSCGTSSVGCESPTRPALKVVTSRAAIVWALLAGFIMGGLSLLARPGVLLGILLFAGGLSFLPQFAGCALLGGIPTLDTYLFGAEGTPLWRSVLPLLGLTLMTLHKKVLLPLLSGSWLGLFGWLLSQLLVALPVLGDAVLGGLPLILDGLWFGLQVLAAWFVARQVLACMFADRR